jgi:hypothetical protein
MKKKPKVQYTIRQVPEEVDRKLREQAVREGASLNYVVLDALASSAGVNGQPAEFHDLDNLAGTWVEDKAFDDAMKAFDQVDEDLWK